MENSQINLEIIKADESLTASTILSENVVTFISELRFTVTPVKRKKIVKLMPVICLKASQHWTLLNLHEFVFTLVFTLDVKIRVNVFSDPGNK